MLSLLQIEQLNWQVAVLCEEQGTKASAHIHKSIVTGSVLMLGTPQNHFPLRPAKCYLFNAGGIGITPIKPMFEIARVSGAEYHLIYLGSKRSRLTFSEDLAFDPQVAVWPESEWGVFNPKSLLYYHNGAEPEPSREHLIYDCGPSLLLIGLEFLFTHLSSGILNMERFENANLTSTSFINKSFNIQLKRSGRDLRSIPDVFTKNGCGMSLASAKGACGTCEAGVLEGVPQHRATVLTQEEKLAGRSMMVCVSRCKGEKAPKTMQ